ncbi:MAG: FKBP-type peptidyl-prolyl cis-trans isomerase [Bacteroidales bacterium]|nr:FKBP-type peptidyl-prolyl cis-trans isomerase [Bacteroidales bacterium]
MKEKLFIQIIGLLAIIILTQCSSQLEEPNKIELKTRMDTVSYIIGLDYGIGIKDEKIEANKIMVYKGLVDGLNGESVLSDSIKNKIVDEFNEELKGRLEEEGKKFLNKNKADGKEFLIENKYAEGVVELPSGLQYKILKQANGPIPSANDSVNVHYRAMFIDRTVFDMSYDRGPAGIRINEVIKGLSEGIQLMNTGAIYELYIPHELAYGKQTFANVIPAGSTLIYTIELIEIIKE